MMINRDSRKIPDTWDEAFKALLPVVRQQSVRVASYTQVLFSEAVNAKYGADIHSYAEQIQGKNADLAYKCALYHQIGKAVVPSEYQIWQNNFTFEEQALYRKYTSDGRILVSMLQEKSIKKKTSDEFVEIPTQNIAWLMIREACQQHNERWDGTGYPEGRKEHQISPIAQIVGLAKMLDYLATDVKSEAPFEEAISTLVAEANTGFNPELIEIMQACRGKLRNVYRKYIQYSKAIPKTIPLVEKRQERPMGLKYRPMIRGKEGHVAAYEAVPWFKGNPDQLVETETLKELEPILRRVNLIDDVMFYFLYEAADTVLRLQNCKLPVEAVVLPIISDFYTTGNKMQNIIQLYQDQPIDKRLLYLTIDQNVLVEPDTQTLDFVKQMIDFGIPFVVDNYMPMDLPMEKLSELGIYNVRFASSMYLSSAIANVMTVMRNNGFKIIGGDVDSLDLLTWLDSCGATFMSGTLTGELIEEEPLIKGLLLKEQENG